MNWARSFGRVPCRVGWPMLSYSTDPRGVPGVGVGIGLRPLLALQRTDRSRCLWAVFIVHPVRYVAASGFALVLPVFRKDGSDHALSQPFQAAWRERVLQGAYFGQEEWLAAIGADRKQLFISVQEAMELNRKLGLKAFAGGWKVLILWLPEAMRVDTANKMLKLIEEPTDQTVMLFVSEQANQLLATIRSVQMVQVPRLGLDEAVEGLHTRFGVGRGSPRAAARDRREHCRSIANAW